MMGNIQGQPFSKKDGESPLKVYREALGYSQEEFARRIGTTLGTYNKWELGRFKEPKFTVRQFKNLKRELARIGVDIDDLPDFLGKPS